MNRSVWLPLTGIAALGLGWGGFELYYAQRIFPSVQGQSGGLTVSEATAMYKEFRYKPSRVLVSAGSQSVSINASELGWRLDYDAKIGRAHV